MTVKSERRARGELPRVLVVDDEPDIRELVDLTLSRMGLAADCAGTVAEAKGLLESGHYQLCLTDMRLPDGEGLELVRHIGERHGDVPVAVITAYGSMENAVAALKAGAFDYLAKPLALDRAPGPRAGHRSPGLGQPRTGSTCGCLCRFRHVYHLPW